MVWDSISTRCVRVALFIILSIAASGCSKKLVSNIISNASCSSRVSPIFTQKAEPSMCLTTFDPAPGVTDVLVGKAEYKARVVSASGLLDSVSSARPIRFAEVEVTTASGQIVACFETEDDGDFGGDVPNNLGVLTVKVKSRSNNSDELLASVLNCPEENHPYSISGTYDPAAPATVSVLADVTGDILGAAFNILDQFYEANKFLKTEIDNCGGDPDAACRKVEEAMPKITAYWVKGFNPNSYFDSPNSGVSFYLPTYSRLFILGGIGDNTTTADTDHFDNSIILHEYGHFLEDIASVTDSPGGSHNGNGLIDPRLAWSEGFGNFIQAAITGIAYYQDTKGHTPGGTATNIFNVSLESSVACTSGCDIPIVQGEGNFREFSITRLLWDVFDPVDGADASGNDDVNDKFIDLWRTMTSTTGLKRTTEGYRSVSLVHDYQEQETSSDWSQLRTNHKHNLTEDYGQNIEATAVPCDYTMDTFYDTNEEYTIKNHLASSSQYDAYANQFNNSDMYYVDLSAAGGTTTITLAATTTAGDEVDLDLYAFKADESIAKSTYAYFDNLAATSQTMSIALSPGRYWLRVLAYTGKNNRGSAIVGDTTIANGGWINAGGTMEYTLKTSTTSYLCPAQRAY